MKMKRGTDHNWEVRKYKGDICYYAHCKCGFQDCCSSSVRMHNEPGGLQQIINKIYPYCPQCGARKKWYNEEPIKFDKFYWE